MSKRIPGPSHGDLAASVRERLAAGRSMAALKEAKELVKRAPGGDAEVLLAAAYRARIADLARQGMLPEARELWKVAAGRLPAAGDWRDVELALTRAAGNVDDLLQRWRDAGDEEARAAAASELVAELRDLTPILTSGVLPDDDLLRQAAARLQDDFRAAADGATSDEAWAELGARAVPAPLVPWHAFVRALAAFHRRDDAAAHGALAGIDDGAGIARGKRILLDLLAVQPLHDDTPAARRVAQRVTDGALELYEALATLRAGGEARAQRAAARVLAVGLAAHRPRAAARLVWFLRGRPEHDALVQELDQKLGVELFGSSEWTRQTADLDAEEDPVLGITAWLTWLMPAAKGDELRRLTPIELAELLHHLTPIAMLAAEAIADRLGVEFAEALGDPELLAARLESLGEKTQPADRDQAITAATLLGEAMRRMRRQAAARPLLADERQIAEHALALDPTADRYAFVLALLEGDEVDARARLLEAWSAAWPDDVEPLALLGEQARELGDPARAQAWLARAERRAASDPRVLALRFRLRFAELRQPARDGEMSVCRLLLDELAADAAAAGRAPRALVAAARVVAGGEPMEVALKAIGDADRARAAVDLVHRELLGAAVPDDEGEAADGEQGAPWRSTRQRIADAAWLASLAGALGTSAAVAVPDGRLGAADVPDDDEDRLALCRLGEERDDWELVLITSGRGLLRDGPHLARFLLHRGRAVERVHEAIDDAEDLLAAAKWFARRDGDADTARAVDLLRRPLSADLDAAAAAAVLEDERKLERDVRKAVAAHARPGRRRPPRVEGAGPQPASGGEP